MDMTTSADKLAEGSHERLHDVTNDDCNACQL